MTKPAHNLNAAGMYNTIKGNQMLMFVSVGSREVKAQL